MKGQLKKSKSYREICKQRWIVPKLEIIINRKKSQFMKQRLFRIEKNILNNFKKFKIQIRAKNRSVATQQPKTPPRSRQIIASPNKNTSVGQPMIVKALI